MKDSNAQAPGCHSGKRFIRENGISKPNRRNHSGTSKVKKSHGHSHEHLKTGSSLLPPPPIPPKRMDRLECDKNTSTKERSSTSTYSTSTYSTSTYSSSTSTYSSCSSNSCTSHSGSDSCSTCSFNDEDEPQKEEEQKSSSSKVRPFQKEDKLSLTKAEKHSQSVNTSDKADNLIPNLKKDANDSCQPSSSAGSCSLTARLRTVFLRHVNIPLHRLDPLLTDPRRRDREEKKEVIDLDLPRFALKSKPLKRENLEAKLTFSKYSDLKPKEPIASTSKDSVVETPPTTIICGGLIQKRELDSEITRRNSLEERSARSEVNKLSLTSLHKTSALFKEINDKIDARKMSLKQEKPNDDTKEINIRKMEQEMKQLLDIFYVTSASHFSSLSEDFLHQQSADSELSANIELIRDKNNDQQHRLPHLHNISCEDSVSTSLDFNERRNTLPSKTLTESSISSVPKQQNQHKSGLAPIRQRASSSNSITHSTEDCTSPLVKHQESVDVDIQPRSLINNSHLKCVGTTSILKSKNEQEDVGNTSPQPIKKSSLLLKRHTTAPTIQQQNKSLSTTPKSKIETKKPITPSTLFTPTSVDLSNTIKIKDKDKNLEKVDQQKDLKTNVKQQLIPKMQPTSSSNIIVPKKISSSNDKEYEEIRKPKAFSVGSKDQFKSIIKRTSELGSISDVKHSQKKRGQHKIRKHGSSSISSDSDEESDTVSSVLWDVDMEEQKRMLEAIKLGTNFGMSMYDRVKRRSSQRPDEERKKSQALEQLREKKSKKKKELNRVRLSSSSDSDVSGKTDKRPLPSDTPNLQQIKNEIEEHHSHSEIDKNEELEDNLIDDFNEDLDKTKSHKTNELFSVIKKPQIAPKKPTMMERIEKERFGDGAHESKESSSSDEWSLSVSNNEKSDNEESGRIGDKIVQKKLTSLVEVAKERVHQTSKVSDHLSDSSSLSASSSSSSSTSSTDNDEDIRMPPKGFPIFKKHVPRKIAKFSMVDVFGEDSDQDEHKNEAKSNVQSNSHNVEKAKKDAYDEPKPEEKSERVCTTSNIKKPRNLKDESIKLHKNDSVILEKKTNIERKRKLEGDLSKSAQKKIDKNEETKKILKENPETEQDKPANKECASALKKSKLASSTSHTSLLSDMVIDKKEKPNETQMVVIATGFVEIDANILKDQQESEVASFTKIIPEHIITVKSCEKQISGREEHHNIDKKIDDSKAASSVFGEYSVNQEELDAIASINPSARSEDVVMATGFVEIDANVLKEQQESEASLESHPEEINTTQILDNKISIQENNHSLDKKINDSKTTSSVEYSINQEELDAIASINPSAKLEEVMTIGFVEIDTNLLLKQENDDTYLDSNTKQPSQQSSRVSDKQIFDQMSDTLNNNVPETNIIKQLAQSQFDNSKGTFSAFGEGSVTQKELDVIANINASVKLEEAAIATGFVEIDANVLKEQQENEETSIEFNTKQIPEQFVTAQTCDIQVSNQEKQHVIDRNLSETIRRQTHFDDLNAASSVFGEYSANKEELDDIANINPSVRLEDGYDKLHRNESFLELNEIQGSKKLSISQFSITQSSAQTLPQFSLPQSSLPRLNLQQSSVPELIPHHSLPQNNFSQPDKPQLSFSQPNIPQINVPQPNFINQSLPQPILSQFSAAQFAAAQSAAAQFTAAQFVAAQFAAVHSAASQFVTPNLPHVQSSASINQKHGYVCASQRTPIVQQLPAFQPPQISQPPQEKRQQSVQGNYPIIWQEQMTIKNADTSLHNPPFGGIQQAPAFQPVQPPTQAYHQKKQHCGGYPIIWQGQLAMKNADTLVQMHKVCGNEQLVERMNHELVSFNDQGIPLLRVNQRMRLEQSQLDNLTRKMEREENYVALICLPCGRDRNDVQIQVEKMTTSFIEYYSSKRSAGIVNSHHQGCVAHIFPPSELSRTLLSKNAPEILKKVDFLGAGYLFIILTNS